VVCGGAEGLGRYSSTVQGWDPQVGLTLNCNFSSYVRYTCLFICVFRPRVHKRGKSVASSEIRSVT